MDGDREEMLFCPVKAIRCYLSGTEHYFADCSDLFICIGRVKKISRDTISFWLRDVISEAHKTAFEEDCTVVRTKAHEVHSIGSSLLFSPMCHAVGLLCSQIMFTTLYLRDVSHRSLDICFVGHVVTT